MSRPEHRRDDDRTGNGIVNHGPDDTPNTDPEPAAGARDADEGDGSAAGPGRVGAGRTGAGETGTGDAVAGDAETGDAVAEAGGARPVAADAGARAGTGAGASGGGAAGSGGTPTTLLGDVPGGAGGVPGDARVDGGDVDEAALRRMLHGAVQGLRPSDGTLDHLHRAVPARRARRRQAVVGAVAAALLIGTAVPALVHVAGSDGSVAANPSIAGHGEQAQGGNGSEAGSGADSERASGPEARQNEGTEDGTDRSASPTPSEGADTEGAGATGLDDAPGVEVATVPACAPNQLGVASAEAGAPGPDGKVYGSFRISNVSGKACSVTSNGTVAFQAAGAADPQKITVVQHAAGDPASGLPHPSAEPGAVLLKPAMAYEVRFAWVPSDTCPTTGGSPAPTPTDGDGGGGTGGSAGAAAGSSDTAAQLGGADDAPADGSVAVTHTPETGAPTAETTISHACAGTIYRTGVLNAS
ncbi:hypothetical protein [Streptomyces sp. NRRL WC-3549]|uniref:hypothetical protein n=1 Tax=Streptomyces sp. NRRL WC-3549 TaxID=1463925 RepID=UPI0004C5B752|nr:hypothetical protein [Streptomyces sp. NRRL WC-3549]